jgi:AcrR family transcriptional regulator
MFGQAEPWSVLPDGYCTVPRNYHSSDESPRPLRGASVIASKTECDGRVLRGQRNTDALIDALLELYRQGNLTPTVTQIAQVAGITPRAVYLRFPDAEAIAREVGKRQFAAHRSRYCAQFDSSGQLSDRIAALVTQRCEMFELIAPVRRSALANAHRSGTIQAQLRFLERLAREQVESAFASELGALDADQRASSLEAADMLTSFETWERLRTRQQLGVDDAKAIVSRLLRSVLADAG